MRRTKHKMSCISQRACVAGGILVAPGVSPGIQSVLVFEPSKRAAEVLSHAPTSGINTNHALVCRPFGAHFNSCCRLPRAYARGYTLPPASQAGCRGPCRNLLCAVECNSAGTDPRVSKSFERFRKRYSASTNFGAFALSRSNQRGDGKRRRYLRARAQR